MKDENVKWKNMKNIEEHENLFHWWCLCLALLCFTYMHEAMVEMLSHMYTDFWKLITSRTNKFMNFEIERKRKILWNESKTQPLFFNKTKKSDNALNIHSSLSSLNWMFSSNFLCCWRSRLNPFPTHITFNPPLFPDFKMERSNRKKIEKTFLQN